MDSQKSKYVRNVPHYVPQAIKHLKPKVNKEGFKVGKGTNKQFNAYGRNNFNYDKKENKFSDNFIFEKPSNIGITLNKYIA